ncbi:recombinase family protein [Tolypothrix sp. FACHB-123]|uniref:fdxN element excision recombinase XisF n=1 Tax=Tolypothrix sp. FACHB-123 TaxID=2692868 RepID=UPI001685248E|nr:fdxN element excision recombinase XisF [Tolypothrix sp. FACHB-123]MBD2358874.1 recombinase family protein [Tolypothrix sp. FACHB-123]
MGYTIGYGRVSSKEQAENQNALKQQLDRLKEAGVDKIYYDVESGASVTRPEFNKMLELVEQGKVDTIIATRCDRLYRNESVHIQFKVLIRLSKVKIKLLDQGEIDLNSAFGELSADLQSLFSVHERRMLRERVQRGFEFRRKNQVAWTRAPWGYGIKNDKYVLDKEPIVCVVKDRPAHYLHLYNEPDTSPELIGISKAQIAREAVDMLLKLRRPRQVLKELYLKYGAERKRGKGTGNGNKGTNLVLSKELLFWNAGSHFKEWLENPVLRGHTAYLKYKHKGAMKPPEDWEMHYDTHPNQRLLTDEEFAEIQDILKSNSRKVGKPGSKFYLTGLVFCGECGHKCVLKRSPEYSYYGCRHSSVGCSNRNCVRTDKIDEAIIYKLFNRANEIVTTPAPQEQHPRENPKLTTLKQQLAGIEKLLEIESNSAILQAKHQLIEEITKQSCSDNSQDFSKRTAEQIISYSEAQKLTFWYTLTLQEREIIYEKLVRQVTILKGEITSVELTIL